MKIKNQSRVKFLQMLVFFLPLLLLTPASAAPVSAQWEYKISIVKGAPTPDMATKAIAMAGMVFGAVTVANGSDSGTIDGKGFSLRSNIKVAALLSMLDSNLNMSRQSTGVYFGDYAFTQSYYDKRGSNPPLQFVVNMKTRQYVFTNGPGPAHIEPYKYMVVDMAMLPYSFIGRPAPKSKTFVAFSDGKTIYNATLAPKAEKLEIGGKDIAAVRLSGTASTSSLDIWVRESDGYPLQMRIGLNAQYGAVLEQRVQAVPNALFVR